MIIHVQAKALAEKNNRDLQAQREQAERHVSGLAFSNPFLALSTPVKSLMKTGDGEPRWWGSGLEFNDFSFQSHYSFWSCTCSSMKA